MQAEMEGSGESEMEGSGESEPEPFFQIAWNVHMKINVLE